MLRASLCCLLLVCPASFAAADESDPLEGKRYASRMFLVNARQESILTGEPTQSIADAQVYRETQAVLVKSRRVVESALRSTDLSNSGLFPKNADEVEWLTKRLVVGYPGDGNVMRIAFADPTAQQDVMRDVVKAVSRAYLDEVVFESKIQRQKPRDILAASYRDLEEEIRRKTDSYFAIARDMRSDRLPENAARVELTKAQIGRLEAEKLALERERLERTVAIKLQSPPAKNSAEQLTMVKDLYAEQIERLDQRVVELTKQVEASTAADASLDSRAKEIAGLTKVLDEIAEKIEHWDVELKSPDRIRPFGGVEFHDPGEEADEKRALLRTS